MPDISFLQNSKRSGRRVSSTWRTPPPSRGSLLSMSDLTVYFHGSCVDGVVSAALATLLAREAGTNVAAFVPCRYPPAPDYFEGVRSTRAWIVDFPFAKGAERFWDHHPTGVSEEDLPLVQARPEFVFDPRAPSCALLVAEELRESPPWVSHMVDEATKIDAARFEGPGEATARVSADDEVEFPNYASPVAATARATPLQQLDAAMSLRWDPDFQVACCKALARKGVAALVHDPEVKKRSLDVFYKELQGLAALTRASECSGGVAFADLTLPPSQLLNRYAIYLVHGDADFSLTVVRRPDGSAKLSTMRNPWREIPSPPLGRWCAEFGGGGHQRVGAVAFPPGGDEAATRASRTLVDRIREFVRRGYQWTGSSTSTTSSLT